MKKLLSAFFVFALALTLRAHSGDWLTDIEAAKKKAAAENKPILALFTGSDWCPACIKWEKEVFSTADSKTTRKPILSCCSLIFLTRNLCQKLNRNTTTRCLKNTTSRNIRPS